MHVDLVDHRLPVVESVEAGSSCRSPQIIGRGEIGDIEEEGARGVEHVTRRPSGFVG